MVTVRRKGGCKCDPCGSDWMNIVKQLWNDYQGTIRTIEVNGKRYEPDAEGMVSYESHAEVIEQNGFFTLICQLSGGTSSNLVMLDDHWLLTTQYIYDMGGYYELNESDSFTYINEGANYLITVAG